jgi:hypothetical protein
MENGLVPLDLQAQCASKHRSHASARQGVVGVALQIAESILSSLVSPGRVRVVSCRDGSDGGDVDLCLSGAAQGRLENHGRRCCRRGLSSLVQFVVP